MEDADVLIASNEQLITDPTVFIRENNFPQTTDDSKPQQQMLQLPRHSLRSRCIEKRAAGSIDMTITLPHPTDQQRDLLVGQCKYFFRNSLLTGILTQNTQVVRPDEDVGRKFL